MFERAIVCGSASDSGLPFDGNDPLRLNAWGSNANVNLRIQNLLASLFKDVPLALIDLIDIAAYVYCGDQAVRRNDNHHEGAAIGDGWRRRMFFRIPVSNVDLWNSMDVRNILSNTLGFLSDDDFVFDFVPIRTARQIRKHFDFDSTPYDGCIDEVMLFSGGLDSTAGAVTEAVLSNKKIMCVNHRSTGKTFKRYLSLVESLESHASKPPIHIPVTINKVKELGREYTQRTRSFLYFSVAAMIAHMIGLDRIRFYENGVVSLNLPLTAQVVGSRASRTTHPKVLNGFSKLFSSLVGKKFQVENPFLWKTKTEVVNVLADAGCSKLIGLTSSCAHVWQMTNQHPHCGTCSQCIDRRFAVLAAKARNFDPGDGYAVDLLVGERTEGEPRTMLAGFLETARKVERMDEAAFFSEFGEASRVLRECSERPSETAKRVYDLYKRHSADVSRVIREAISENAAAIYQRELSPNCLLSLVFLTRAEEPIVIPAADPEPLSKYLFRREGRVWRYRFAGGRMLTLPGIVGAEYLHEALSRPNHCISVVELVQLAQRNRRAVLQYGGIERNDEDALENYRRRSNELQEELEDARNADDTIRETRIREEMNSLSNEIRSSQGFNGRVTTVLDDCERRRKSVTNALDRVIDEIDKYDPAFAGHLRSKRYLKIGRHVCYSPDPDIVWET